MACLVHQHEPEVARDLGPTSHLAVDCPDLLWGALPLGDALPVQRIEVVEYSGCVDHEIVLAVVDQHLDPSEQVDHIASVAPGDIGLEGVIDIIASGDVVHSIGDSELFPAVVEQRDEGHISLAVLPEVVGAHASPILVSGVVVVGQEVEE